MSPRIWSKQLFFIPIAFITVWFIFNFTASLAPANLLSEDVPNARRMRIVDNIIISQPNSSIASTKAQFVRVDANYVEETIKNKQPRSKAKTTTAFLRNFTQSAINKISLSLIDIRRKIAKINSEQKVLNAERFQPLSSDLIVIVVQVHNRKVYLEYLIDSLRAASGISDALLIFSHDFFDEDINNLIATINFCRVMQIFYPLSIQLIPNKFPGTDPKDCPPKMTKDQAIAIACENAFNPDQYGHYRDAAIVQLKHHWWWKANWVFQLNALRNYDGHVIFLEEDLYVVDDFIPSMRLMQKATKVQCKNCKILSLAANQDAVNSNRADFTRSSRATVTSQFSNMGLAFSTETWKEMQECAHVFCRFDDYNWDVTMQHIFTTCMKNTAAMTLNAPRVFHIGSCGTHHTSNDCDSSQKIKEISDLIRRHHSYLYPESLDIQFNVDHRRSEVSYGGWGDVRDQGLCLKNVIRS